MLKETLLFAITVILCSCMYIQGDDLIGQLKSDYEGARVKAKNSILAERKRLIEGLIEIVKEKQNEGDYVQQNHRKLLAVQLLGEIRASEAVDTLLDNLLTIGPSS